jgi:hypothetical protein
LNEAGHLRNPIATHPQEAMESSCIHFRRRRLKKLVGGCLESLSGELERLAGVFLGRCVVHPRLPRHVSGSHPRMDGIQLLAGGRRLAGDERNQGEKQQEPETAPLRKPPPG